MTRLAAALALLAVVLAVVGTWLSFRWLGNPEPRLVLSARDAAVIRRFIGTRKHPDGRYLDEPWGDR